MTISLGILLHGDGVLMSLISGSLSSSNEANTSMTTGSSIGDNEAVLSLASGFECTTTGYISWVCNIEHFECDNIFSMTLGVSSICLWAVTLSRVVVNSSSDNRSLPLRVSDKTKSDSRCMRLNINITVYGVRNYISVLAGFSDAWIT